MKDKDKIQARDGKLLKNEKSWRRARVGAVFFAVVWLLSSYMFFKSYRILEEEKQALYYSIGWLLFWTILIDCLNMRIRHIDSIKYYRNEKKTAEL